MYYITNSFQSQVPYQSIEKYLYDDIIDIMITKRRLQKFLKEKELNVVKYISSSHSMEFKKCFAVIERFNGETENIVIPNTSNGYIKDFNNFMIDYLTNNKLSSSFIITLDTTLNRNTTFTKYCTTHQINHQTFHNKRDLSKFQTFGKKLIINERKHTLQELQNYDDNVMLYTDGSKINNKFGMACIIDESKTKDVTKLSSTLFASDLEYSHFEVDAISLGLQHVMNDDSLKNKKVIITTDSDYANSVCFSIKTDSDLQEKHPIFYNLLKDINFNFQVNLIKSHVNKLNNNKNLDFKYNAEADVLARDTAKYCTKKRKKSQIKI